MPNTTLAMETTTLLPPEEMWKINQIYQLGTVLGLIALCGVIGNILVIIVYTTKLRQLRSRFKFGQAQSSAIFILALACNDLTVTAGLIPATWVLYWRLQKISSEVLCKVYYFFNSSTVPLSAFIMVCISIDRYCCLIHATSQLMTLKRAKIMLLISVLLATVMGSIVASMFSTSQWFYDERINQTNTNGQFNNMTQPVLHYTGNCDIRDITNQLFLIYPEIHNGSFYVCCMVTMVLYTRICVFVIRRRKRSQERRARTHNVLRKLVITPNLPSDDKRFQNVRRRFSQAILRRSPPKQSPTELPTAGCMLDGNTAVINDGGVNEVLADDTTQSAPRLRQQRRNTLPRLNEQTRLLVENIRIAGMLFVVCIVFILTYLPALFMLKGFIPFNPFIFFSHFLMNICNPLIYSIMNKTFRQDLQQLCCRRQTKRPNNNARKSQQLPSPTVNGALTRCSPVNPINSPTSVGHNFPGKLVDGDRHLPTTVHLEYGRGASQQSKTQLCWPQFVKTASKEQVNCSARSFSASNLNSSQQ